MGSGEYILWPYITTNVGLGFLWAAVVGVTVQYFLNMEIERYTLATGETAVAGFARFWKPWGILFCVFAIVPNMWPGWGTAGATIFTYLVGGNPNVIAIILLLSIGVALTASPVVYQTLEKAEFFKVGLTIVFLIIAIFAAIKASAWADLPDAVSGFGKIPSDEVAIATILAGLVFAGAGGANNLVQSNWIRDKGFGMGAYVPQDRLADHRRGPGGPVHRHDGAPGRGEHRALQPLVQAGLQGAARLLLGSSASARSSSSRSWPTRPSTARTSPRRRTSTSSRREGNVLKDVVAPWFGTFFWIFGSLSLALVALGVVDYVSRLVADVTKTLYARDNERWSESKIYFLVVWSMVTFGIDHPALGLRPAARAARALRVPERHRDVHLLDPAHPPQPQVAAARRSGSGASGSAALFFAVAFYGFFAGWLVIVQIGDF